MTRAPLAAAIVGVALAAVALTGCSSSAASCTHRVDSDVAAVQGLIDAARTAHANADVCAWLTEDYSVSSSELAALQKPLADVPDSALSIRPLDQMGSAEAVDVYDGDTRVLALDLSVKAGAWAVSYGDYTGPKGPLP